jgi:hypothetical protein
MIKKQKQANVLFKTLIYIERASREQICIHVLKIYLASESSRKLKPVLRGKPSKAMCIAKTSATTPSKSRARLLTSKEKQHKTDSRAFNCIPHYRIISQNLYRAPLTRKVCDEDEIPVCCCTNEAGLCDEYCQNRMLFMYALNFFCACFCAF